MSLSRPIDRWCPGKDSNLHGCPRYHLKVVRLPIPPPGLKLTFRPSRRLSACPLRACPRRPSAFRPAQAPRACRPKRPAPRSAAARRRPAAGGAVAGAGFSAGATAPDITPRSSVGRWTRALSAEIDAHAEAEQEEQSGEDRRAARKEVRRSARTEHGRRCAAAEARTCRGTGAALQKDQDDHGDRDQHIKNVGNNRNHAILFTSVVRRWTARRVFIRSGAARPRRSRGNPGPPAMRRQ